MRIVSFPDMPKPLLISCLAVVSGCGTSPSEANIVSVFTENQVAAAAPAPVPAITPSAAKRDDMLSLSNGATIPVKVDDSKVSQDGPRDIKLLARHGRLIALADTYPSKPQGLGRCQAGGETWFRVIDTRSGTERYARMVDSCLGSEQWGDPPVTVSAGGGTITLNLLSEPPVTVRLGDDGRVLTAP